MKNATEETGSVLVHETPESTSAFGKFNLDKKDIQKKMEAAGTPGPAHKALDAFKGNWKAEVKCWSNPGGSPELSHGTAKVSWILNGRFLEEEFHGEMMGKPFTGRALMGYNNIKHTFDSIWMSDMQTWMFVSEGKGDSGNKVITLEGKGTCPATGRTDVPIRTVFRTISSDKHVFEMFDRSKAEKVKTMEITYTRV